jgi:hypothetical protein
MASDCSTLGPLLRPSQKENWAPTGLSRVVKPSLPSGLRLTLSQGYDHTIEQHIYYMLNDNTSFREQVAGLYGVGVEIEIELEMSYHSWTTFLTFCSEC